MKVLLVEDDFVIAEAINRSLVGTGLSVETVHSLHDARAILNVGEGTSMVVLDLSLPDGDGLEFLYQQRRNGLELPVLILTARDEPRQRVLGLDSGADDYLTKPFDMDELIARIRALQRRSMGRAASVIEYQRLRLDPAQMRVFLDGNSVELPTSQFRLLQYLLEPVGRVRTKQQIIEALYRWDQSVKENTIEVYISQLRKQLWPALIKTIRGIGYSVPTNINTQ